MSDLVEGTLADLATLMASPPEIRRGYTKWSQGASPAAGAAYTAQLSNDWWRRLLSLTCVYTASASAGQRIPVFNVLNPDGLLLNQTQLGPPISAGEAWLLSADTWGSNQFLGGPSVTADGVATGPLASQVICSAALTAGEWTANWQVGVGGTTGGVEQDNFQLVIGSTVLLVSENSQTSGNNTAQPAVTFEVPAGGATLAIQAVGNGTATAVYRAQFSASQSSGLAAYQQIPDLILPSGWQIQITATGMLSGDTITSITTIVEHYASNWADGSLGSDEERLARAIVRALRGES